MNSTCLIVCLCPPSIIAILPFLRVAARPVAHSLVHMPTCAGDPATVGQDQLDPAFLETA